MRKSATAGFVLGLVAVLGIVGDVISWGYHSLACGLGENQDATRLHFCRAGLAWLSLLGIPMAVLGFVGSLALDRMWPIAVGATAAVVGALMWWFLFGMSGVWPGVLS
jgi:hypothetical protein